MLPAAALALSAPTDQVIPNSGVVPATRLLVHLPGTLAGWSVPGVSVSAASAASITGAAPESVGGRFFRFQAGSAAGGRVVVNLAPNYLTATGQAATPLEASSVLNGATVSFWYRRPAAQAKVAGWNPLVLIGDDWGGENWKYGVVLKDGVAIMARRGGTELFGTPGLGAKSSAGTVKTSAIDDGAWHHIALRISRPGCVAGACAKLEAALVSLFVDSVVVGETLTPISADTHKVFVGSLPAAGAYASQTNYDATNARLNTMGDIDDVYVYQAALSPSEVLRLHRARPAALRFQIPALDPQKLGWTGPSPQVGTLPASTLKSRPLAASSTAIDLLRDGGVPGTATEPSDLEGVGEHTLVLWTTLPVVDGALYQWEPVAGKGWSILRKAGQIGIRCSAGDSWRDTSLSADGWHRVVVSVSADNLSLTVDDAFSWGLACTGAGATAGSTPTLWMSRPDVTRLAWAAFQVDQKPLADLLAVSSPGPGLWFEPPALTDMTGMTPFPFLKVGDGTTQWVYHQDTPGTIRRIEIPITGPFLRGTASWPGRDFTISLEVKVTSVDTSIQGAGLFPLASRRSPNFGFASTSKFGNVDANFYLDCRSYGCFPGLCVASLTKPKGACYVLARHFPLNQLSRLSVAWPVNRALPFFPGDTGTPTTVTEPVFAIDGVVQNRKYLVDANPIEFYDDRWNTVDAEQNAWWVIGDTTNSHIPNGTAFELHHVRIYGRAIEDTPMIGAGCTGETLTRCSGAHRICTADAALSSAMCTACDAQSFVAGGVETGDPDCLALAELGESCLSGAECASGQCRGGYCAPATLSTCQSYCYQRGRSCTGGTPATFACGGCAAGFEALPNTPAGALSVTATCGWSPKKTWPTACTTDAECTSGACRDITIDNGSHTSYSLANHTNQRSCPGSGGCGTGYVDVTAEVASAPVTSYSVSRKVCLAAEASECTAAPWYATVQSTSTVTRPDGSSGTAHQCATTSGGICSYPFVRARPVLTHGACQQAALRTADQVGGNCERKYCWSCAGCKTYSHFSVADSPTKSLFFKGNGLGLLDLKKVFLNDFGGTFTTSDESRLRDAGVGPLLLAYAAASATEKAKMVAKYGKFEPLRACAVNNADGLPGGRSAFAYHSDANHSVCSPKLQPDGATCPPAGVTSPPGKEWCRSRYCARDTHVCERGDNPLNEIRGDAGNKNRSGKSAVKFGVVRVDDTRVNMAEEQPNNNEYRYKADISQSYVSCLLGAPVPASPLFETKIALDRSEGPECGSTEVSNFVVGFKLTAPSPGALAGSCTLYKPKAGASAWDICQESLQCTPVNPANLSGATLASMLIPTLKFCAPFDEDSGFSLPEIKKDFKEFLVPLYVSLGVTLDLCLSVAVGLDDAGLPQVEVKPNVGVGVEAKGGVGIAETAAYEIGAGIRLAVTLVDISFPITWGIELADIAGQLGLLKLSVIQKIAMELDILSGDFGLFAEFSIGLLSFEWTLTLFEWTGLLYHFDLSEIPLFSTKLDFREAFLAALAGSAKATCDTGPNSPCYK